jgi:hypothetical protein
MPESDDRKPLYVRVWDRAGKEYICPLSALKDPKDVTEEELKYCLDSTEEVFTDSEVMAIIKSDLEKE